jgi:hypothetical protein
MSRNSDSDGGWVKWVIGTIISLLAAGSGIVALVSYFAARPTPVPRPSPPSTQRPTQVVCSVSGHVYNSDKPEPLPNIEVRYFRFTREGETQYQVNVRSYLATTDTNGSFSADCSGIETGNFPLRLELSSSTWNSGTLQTDTYVQAGKRTTGINLYVSDKMMKSNLRIVTLTPKRN